VLVVGVVVLGITDVQRAAAFWTRALGYEVRSDGFGRPRLDDLPHRLDRSRLRSPSPVVSP
jgi:catechol 2,3-dioxygenase-like lactoylglutathione lyase family enzyme